MDIQGKSIVVLGGWGLVGSAVCRKLMEYEPRQIVVTSLREHEAREAVAKLYEEYPDAGADRFVPWWGNIFVRSEFKDLPREEILTDSEKRSLYIHDVLDELNDDILQASALYEVISRFKPDILVDCINSATGIAYQNVFQVAREVMKEMDAARRGEEHNLEDTVESLLGTLYVPQLIRHIQVIYNSMVEAGTKTYVKIGTSGTGGMGLNIPYTHSEERPSRVLLSKSAVAGAHSLLLFLMGRTPDAPMVKEIKPTGAIAWKSIGVDQIKRHGKPIPLFDAPVENARPVSECLSLSGDNEMWKARQATLRSVFIDTGENGTFSRGEFEAITTAGQMEFVTPEEVAEDVVREIRGGNTGHDIVNALDNAVLEPTYRAGFMLHTALSQLNKLEQETGEDSVAFELLGPPRLSKLLYEAYLLKRLRGSMLAVRDSSAEDLSREALEFLSREGKTRSNILSIGIAVLLPDGTSMLRGPVMKIPPGHQLEQGEVTPELVDKWAHDGWVDLRVSNFARWKSRIEAIMAEVDDIPKEDTSSRFIRSREYWENFQTVNIGKLAGWIFDREEHGARMKS